MFNGQIGVGQIRYVLLYSVFSYSTWIEFNFAGKGTINLLGAASEKTNTFWRVGVGSETSYLIGRMHYQRTNLKTLSHTQAQLMSSYALERAFRSAQCVRFHSSPGVKEEQYASLTFRRLQSIGQQHWLCMHDAMMSCALSWPVLRCLYCRLFGASELTFHTFARLDIQPREDERHVPYWWRFF